MKSTRETLRALLDFLAKVKGCDDGCMHEGLIACGKHEKEWNKLMREAREALKASLN